MSFPVVVMDFTHVYEDEKFLYNNIFRWLDCTSFAGTDCYCSDEAALQINKMISIYPPNGIHLIDSGNYHYLTKFWTDKILAPFSLVVFDHHPDMQPTLFENIMSCGSWVREMLETNKYLKNVFIIGASEKLHDEIKGFDNRVVFFGEHSFENSETWIKFSSIHVSTSIYISVDKDVLNPEYARTNWDQGSLSLYDLEKLLHIIIDNETVIGIDICGENNICNGNYLNEDRIINEHTDKELLHFIIDSFKKKGNRADV